MIPEEVDRRRVLFWELLHFDARLVSVFFPCQFVLRYRHVICLVIGTLLPLIVLKINRG
jgi:hypothetical protein